MSSAAMTVQPAVSLLALGLDGGDLPFIRRNRRSLPTLSLALERGRLFEPDPPFALSGAVWPTFYNGRQPGHHGLYQHLVWDAQRMGIRRIGPDWCFYRPFWKSIEARDRDVAVFDVPYSFPGALRSGLEITDWGTHGQTWPLACSDPQVRRWLGRSPIGRETPVRKTAAQLDRIRVRLKASAHRKGQVIGRLITERRPDVLIAVFGETHRGGHTLFTPADERGDGTIATALLDVYRAVDAAIAQILDRIDPVRTRTLIFSLHGMELDRAQGHLVRPLLRRINENFVAQELGRRPHRRERLALVRWLRSRVPAGLQHAIGDAAPDRLRQWVVEQEMVGATDWTGTPGFALRTDIRTELRLNLRGREAQGILEPNSAALERYVQLLRRSLLELVDLDNGGRLVEDLVAIPELFPGPRADRLPDLVITWRPCAPATRVEAPAIGRLTAQAPLPRGGDHTEHGFAILSGDTSSAEPLPTLEHASDFAAFISALATRPGAL